MKNDFCVFILTNGRPHKVVTHNTLARQNYTGEIFYIVDDEDQTLDEYIELFGREKVYVFDKKAYADSVDEGNNFDDRRTIVHARNACFEAAKDLGFKYFLELDDDYQEFDFRIDIDGGLAKPIKNLDSIFDKMIDFFNAIPCKSIALAQGGDFIGGINNGKRSYRFNKRKCMNSFLCSVDRPFQFIGSINEDVNTYTLLASRGDLFLTIPFASLTQRNTQTQNKGMSDWYKKYGTYCKSFTSVMFMPSSIKIKVLNSSRRRLHHSIDWTKVTPQIIPESFKK